MIDDVVEAGRDDAGGVDWLLVRRLLAPPADVARVLLAEARGHRVVTDDDALVDALVAGGGTVQRRGCDYTYDVATAPRGWASAEPPPPYRLGRDLDPVRLAPAHERANPPGHPDHEPGLDHVEDLRAMLEGRVLGPCVTEATWQVGDGDGPCGAVVVVDRKGRGWVVDVFVDPAHQGRGLGRVLLQRAVAGTREAGLPSLGLAVSDGNPARHAYESLGFRAGRPGTNVDIPLLS